MLYNETCYKSQNISDSFTTFTTVPPYSIPTSHKIKNLSEKGFTGCFNRQFSKKKRFFFVRAQSIRGSMTNWKL